MEVNIHEAKTHLSPTAAGCSGRGGHHRAPESRWRASSRLTQRTPSDHCLHAPGVSPTTSQGTSQTTCSRPCRGRRRLEECVGENLGGNQDEVTDSGVWLHIDLADRIGKRGLDVLSNSREEIYFSAASVWELTIKAHLKKLTLPAPPADCIPPFMARQGLRPLPVNHIHAVKVYDLSSHHRDPFDRLLTAHNVEGFIAADRGSAPSRRKILGSKFCGAENKTGE